MPINGPTRDLDDAALNDLAITKVSDSLCIAPDKLSQKPFDLSDFTDNVDIAWRIGQGLGLKTHTVQMLAQKLATKKDIPGVVSAIREVLSH